MNVDHPRGPSTAADEAAEVLVAIERVRRARESRAAAAPCGLFDHTLCPPGGCDLRGEEDCPVRMEAERLAAEQAQAAAAAKAGRDAAIALGYPRRVREELGLEPGAPSLRLADNDALRAVRGPAVAILILAGATGTGKTTAAAAWAWPRRGLWRTAGDLARMSWYEKGAVQQLVQAAALVVDDLGVQVDDTKGVWRSRLGELVAARFGERRPTLITTNHTGDDLRRILDDRIKDRLRQDGRVVECVGESLRVGQRELPGVEG
jgi:hypothetical protein